jgi:type I restriction enzyme, S subunit
MKNGWENKRLGDVCEFVKEQGEWTGLPYVGLEHIESNTGVFLGSRLPQTVRSTTFRFTPEHVLYGRLRPYLNKVLLPDFVGHCSTEIFPVKPTEQLDRSYFSYWLRSDETVAKINATWTGARMPRANMNQVLKFNIPVPPIEEQRRIAAILDEAFAAIDKAKANTEKNIQNARELFDSYLNNIFSNPGPDWETTTLGSVGKVSMCKRIYKEQTSAVGDIPFYKIGTFGKDPDAFISAEIYNDFRKKFSFPRKSEVLISAAGTIGRRVRYDGKPAYFQDSNIVWVANDERRVTNDYLYHFYGSCKWVSTDGATIARLYNDDLRELSISFPRSLGEQVSIVQGVEELSTHISNLESNYRRQLDKLNETRKALLQKAFDGKI